MAAKSLSSEDFESMTDEDLAKPTPCPAGVPQKLWDQTMAQNAEYAESWQESVQAHIAEYDKKNPEPATA